MKKCVASVDIFSHFAKKQYAEKGDKLSIISKSEGVLIVEDKNGKRFPVRIEKVVEL